MTRFIYAKEKGQIKRAVSRVNESYVSIMVSVSHMCSKVNNIVYLKLILFSIVNSIQRCIEGG
jgi:hypothetical protein